MNKPIRVAAWCGIISIILSFLVIITTFALAGTVAGSVFLILVSLVGGVLSVLYFNGFLVLAGKFDATLLKVMTWIGIVITILYLVFGLIGNIASTIELASAQAIELNPDTGNLGDDEVGLAALILGFFLVIWIMISVVFGAYTVLFGIGILKLKDKVPYANATGILNIISGATYIIFIGFLVRVVAYIFEIVMLFKASEKFEK